MSQGSPPLQGFRGMDGFEENHAKGSRDAGLIEKEFQFKNFDAMKFTTLMLLHY